MEEIRVGDIAYLDGRDPQAQPPLTVGTINLWNSPSRQRVVGQLRHGTRVRILEKAWAGERWHYRIQHWLKSGWVPASFLSRERHEPIGDLV